MASIARRLENNVEGEVYVDDSCIDCGACRWIDPTTFDAVGGQSRVYRQPNGDGGLDRALMALVACPTSSIGTITKQPVAEAARRFPNHMADGIYHLGFHAESSFGAASYLLVRPEGNIMVDSPRFNRGLADRIEALGGVKAIFLTHRDDVADHDQWHERFGAPRWLHTDDISSRTRHLEEQFSGTAPIPLENDVLILPTPGHTRGSACLLWSNAVFTGDHLAYRPSTDRVIAFRRACWYDWAKQIRSMQVLAEYSFEWILPGHGAPCEFPAPEMAERLARCIAWMKGAR